MNNPYNYNSIQDAEDGCISSTSGALNPDCCKDPKYEDRCCFGYVPDPNNNPSCELIGRDSCNSPGNEILCKNQGLNCSTGKNACQADLNRFMQNKPSPPSPPSPPQPTPPSPPSPPTPPSPSHTPGHSGKGPGGKKFWNSAGGIITIIVICLAIALGLVGVTYFVTKKKGKK